MESYRGWKIFKNGRFWGVITPTGLELGEVTRTKKGAKEFVDTEIIMDGFVIHD